MKVCWKLIVITFFLTGPCLSSAEWKVQYGWTSGWGGDQGILITFQGEAGPITDGRYDRFTECPSERLQAAAIAEIEDLLAEIPEDIPKHSRVEIIDHCYDEKEHLIIVSKGEKKQAFAYSADAQCVNAEDIPGWMKSLTVLLMSHYERIKDCD